MIFTILELTVLVDIMCYWMISMLVLYQVMVHVELLLLMFIFFNYLAVFKTFKSHFYESVFDSLERL